MTSRRLEREVVRNRRDIEQVTAELAAAVGTRQSSLTFRNIEISLSASAALDERSITDQFAVGLDGANGVGRGGLGDRTGSWSEVATHDDVAVAAVGRAALAAALAGGAAGGAETARLGDDGTAPDRADTALGNPVGATDAWGETTDDDTATGVAVFRIGVLPGTIREIALEDGDGTLWARATVDDESPDGTTEYRVRVELTLSVQRTGSGAVTALGRLRDALASEDGAAITTAQIGLGTDDTDPDASDTDLGSEVITKDAAAESAGPDLTLFTYIFRNEPNTQPHDLAEIAAFDADDTMLWRLTFDPTTKDDDTRVRPQTGLEVV